MDNGWGPVGIYLVSRSSRPLKPIHRPPQTPIPPPGALFASAASATSLHHWFKVFGCCNAVYAEKGRLSTPRFSQFSDRAGGAADAAPPGSHIHVTPASPAGAPPSAARTPWASPRPARKATAASAQGEISPLSGKEGPPSDRLPRPGPADAVFCLSYPSFSLSGRPVTAPKTGPSFPSSGAETGIWSRSTPPPRRSGQSPPAAAR